MILILASLGIRLVERFLQWVVCRTCMAFGDDETGELSNPWLERAVDSIARAERTVWKWRVNHLGHQRIKY